MARQSYEKDIGIMWYCTACGTEVELNESIRISVLYAAKELGIPSFYDNGTAYAGRVHFDCVTNPALLTEDGFRAWTIESLSRLGLTK